MLFPLTAKFGSAAANNFEMLTVQGFAQDFRNPKNTNLTVIRASRSSPGGDGLSIRQIAMPFEEVAIRAVKAHRQGAAYVDLTDDVIVGAYKARRAKLAV